jgi:predicted GIY-YIG superfamily endonuclease
MHPIRYICRNDPFDRVPPGALTPDTLWVVYCLRLNTGHGDTNPTYVGCTNNLQRRIRQHNKEIKGGARYTTTRGGPWVVLYCISVTDGRTARRLEWRLKHVHTVTIRGGGGVPPPTYCAQGVAAVANMHPNERKRTAALVLRLMCTPWWREEVSACVLAIVVVYDAAVPEVPAPPPPPAGTGTVACAIGHIYVQPERG